MHDSGRDQKGDSEGKEEYGVEVVCEAEEEVDAVPPGFGDHEVQPLEARNEENPAIDSFYR